MNHRWAPWTLAGMGFAAAVVVEAIAFPGGASSSDPASAIAAYYQRHGSTDLVADYISLLATPLLLAFLCRALGRLPGPAKRYAQATATAAAVFELTATGIEMSLAAATGRSAPADITAALFQITPRLFYVSLLCLGLCIGTIAAADQGWRRLLGAVAAVALTAAGLSAAHPHGLLSLLLLPAEALLVAWVLATVVTERHTPSPQPVSPSVS